MTAVEQIEAEKNKRMVEDPKGFFVVFVDKPRREIVVEVYDGVSKEDSGKTDTGKLRAVMCGTDAEAICHTIAREKLVSRFEHASYLGREIQKAEIALKARIPYEQDGKLKLKR